MNNKNKILIIKLEALGDVLRTTSLLPALKEKYKNSSIIWLTSQEAAPLLFNNSFIDKIHQLNSTTRKKITKESFNLIINLDEDLKACQLASQIKGKIIGPYSSSNQIIYTVDSREWFDMGLISRFGKEKADQLKEKNKKSYPQMLVNMIGTEFNKDRDRPQMILDKKEKDFGQNFLKNNNISRNRLIIGLNTDAGEKWSAKKISVAKTVRLAEDLVKEFDAQIISLSESWKKRNQEIIKRSKINLIDSGSNDLRRFATVVNLCDLVISSDSLVLQIAIALGKKNISFFGPTPAVEIETYGLGEKIIPPVDCHFCYRHRCKFKEGCLEKLDNQLFINAAKRVLNT